MVGNNMQMETKFVHFRDSVEFGARFGDWQVSWIGGWARFRLYFLVMLVKIPLPVFPQGCDEARPGGARILVADRTIDLAFGANRDMNGVGMNTFTSEANNTSRPSLRFSKCKPLRFTTPRLFRAFLQHSRQRFLHLQFAKPASTSIFLAFRAGTSDPSVDAVTPPRR